jgi:hypothetical protein
LARVSSRRLASIRRRSWLISSGDSGDALRHRFEFERKLAALAAEGFHLKVRVGEFSFQTRASRSHRPGALRLARVGCEARNRRHRVKDGDARFFLLVFEFGQCGGRSGSFLLRQREFMLSRSQIGSGGLQHLPVGIALGLERGQPLTGLRQFGLCRSGANHQLGAAFVIVAARACARSISMASWLRRSRFSRSSVSMA